MYLCDCVFTVPFVLCTVVMLVVYAVQGLKFVGFIYVLYSLQIVPINDCIFTFQLEKANAVFLSLLIWFEMWLLQYSNIHDTFDTNKNYTVYNITDMIIYCEQSSQHVRPCASFVYMHSSGCLFSTD